jgi:hypothetical protein
MGQPEQARWVAHLLIWEGAERDRRSLERRLRAAHIGRFKPLAAFDWAWPTRIERAADLPGLIETVFPRACHQSMSPGLKVLARPPCPGRE